MICHFFQMMLLWCKNDHQRKLRKGKISDLNCKVWKDSLTVKNGKYIIKSNFLYEKELHPCEIDGGLKPNPR